TGTEIISGLFINRSATENIGLIGHASGASISGFSMTGADITGSNYTGGIIGRITNGTEISNVHFEGQLTSAGGQVGGIAGGMNGTGTGETRSGEGSSDVALLGNTGGKRGGIVGWGFYLTVTDTHTRVVITMNGDNIGGFAGLLTGTINISR